MEKSCSCPTWRGARPFTPSHFLPSLVAQTPFLRLFAVDCSSPKLNLGSRFRASPSSLTTCCLPATWKRDRCVPLSFQRVCQAFAGLPTPRGPGHRRWTQPVSLSSQPNKESRLAFMLRHTRGNTAATCKSVFTATDSVIGQFLILQLFSFVHQTP